MDPNNSRALQSRVVCRAGPASAPIYRCVRSDDGPLLAKLDLPINIRKNHVPVSAQTGALDFDEQGCFRMHRVAAPPGISSIHPGNRRPRLPIYHTEEPDRSGGYQGRAGHRKTRFFPAVMFVSAWGTVSQSACGLILLNQSREIVDKDSMGGSRRDVFVKNLRPFGAILARLPGGRGVSQR